MILAMFLLEILNIKYKIWLPLAEGPQLHQVAILHLIVEGIEYQGISDWKQTIRSTAIAWWQTSWSNKKLYMTFAIKLYDICLNGLYFWNYLIRKYSFNVFALSPSIGKLLWCVFNQCLPQTVNYKIITTNHHEAYTFQDFLMTLVAIFKKIFMLEVLTLFRVRFCTDHKKTWNY